MCNYMFKADNAVNVNVKTCVHDERIAKLAVYVKCIQ